MIDPKNGQKYLALAPNWFMCTACIIALANVFRVKASGVTAGANDTVFSYYVVTDERLTKTREKEVETFLAGVLWGVNHVAY